MNALTIPMRPVGRRPRGAMAAVMLVASLGILMCTASGARAQVFMDAQPVALPSVYPSDWSSTHSLCRVLMTNQAGEPIRCDLRVKIESGGGSATVTVPKLFSEGVTFLTTTELTDWSNLAFQGSLKDAMKRTGHLPARPITITVICENMFGFISNNPVTVNGVNAVEDTITIVPSLPPPPTLLTPSDASRIRVTNPVFTWTPVRLTTGQEVWYQFRLVRVLAGQTASRAVEANHAVLETFVHQSSLPYPSAAPRLEDGALYAWRVQALLGASPDLDDVPVPGEYANIGLNEGRSRVYSFVWQAPAAGGSDAPRRTGGGDGRFGSLIGIGSDPDAAPRVATDVPGAPLDPASTRIPQRLPTPSDSIALAMFAPRGQWWGPSSGGRTLLAGATAARPPGVFASGAAPGMESAPSPDASGLPAGSEGPRRVPIQVDGDTPEGEGVATRWFRVSGTSIAAGELYSRTGAGLPSRPDNNGQFMAGMRVSMFGDKVHVPLRMLISGDQVSFRQTLNQIGVHPEWRWGGLHVGHFSPGYSSFSMADATVLGGGADIVRGNWYAGFANGSMQKAIQPDLIHAVEARYARNVMAGRIGYGKPLGNALEFEVMRARDDDGSLASGDSLVHVAPAGNMVYGMRARHTVFDSLTTVQVEGAWSRYERNITADGPTVDGGATGVRIQRVSPLGEIGAAFEYIGGGFVTLANSGLAPDRMEGRLNGRRMFQDGRLRLGGSVGFRRDDISNTLGGATHRRSYGTQVGWQPLPLFGAEIDAGVLSSRSPGTPEREGLEELTTSVTVSPHLTWSWNGSTQVVTTSFSLQETEFSGPDEAGFANSRNTTVVAGWQSSVTSWLFVNVSGNYVKSESGGFDSEIGSVGPGLSMTLWGGRAMTNLQLQITETRVDGFGLDRDLAPTIDLRYLVTGRQMLVFRAGGRRFRSGVHDGDFEERLATLQYSASL